MDKIKFRVYDGNDDLCDPGRRVSILINRRSLLRIIHNIEFNAAKGNKDQIMDYYNICVEELKEELETYTRPTVLGCTCGIKDCCPLTVDVHETETTVVWSNFKHPSNRRHPVDYSMLKFEFDKAQYYHEVNLLNTIKR